MTKKDMGTKPDPKDAEKPMKPSGTARQPTYTKPQTPGAASSDPTE